MLDDVDHAHVLNPILREKGIKSLLGVPLMVSDSVLGVIHVGTLEPRLFTPDDQALLELVASRAALAIEKARIHEETVRLDQLKLNFVAVASHELRTPATAIYGITRPSAHGAEIAEETRVELEESLWGQVNRLRILIEQLLDLSRLDARAMAIEPQPIGLRAVLAEIAAETEREQDVHIDVAEDLEVHADRLALERIMDNLVGNALRYGAPPVVVTAHPMDTYLRVSVEDEGEGVPPEVVPRLFERFERGSRRRGKRPGAVDRPGLCTGARRRPHLRPLREGRRALRADPPPAPSALLVDEAQDALPRIGRCVGELLLLAVEEAVRRAVVRHELVLDAGLGEGLLEGGVVLGRDVLVVAGLEREDRALHLAGALGRARRLALLAAGRRSRPPRPGRDRRRRRATSSRPPKQKPTVKIDCAEGRRCSTAARTSALIPSGVVCATWAW